MNRKNVYYQSRNTMPNIWPALVDVIIATLMILLLFMIIQHISFFLSDALKRIEIKNRQGRLVQMIKDMETTGKIPKDTIQCETIGDHQKLRFSSALLFPLGKAEIPPDRMESFKFLDALGEILHRTYYENRLFDQIYIEGHTDTTPIYSKRYPSNWELSTARAVYITKYFLKHKILLPSLSDKRFLGAAGYGEYNYIMPNDTEEGKAANRRIEILLVYSER
ncbi:MAG: OmpA family protein [Desulfobacterales bacterium]|nr:OmpA family protein [Desulfobacterales bacterium]